MYPFYQAKRAALRLLWAAPIALLLALIPGAAAAGKHALSSTAAATVRLEPSSQGVEVGQTVPVSLLVDNVSGLFGVEIRLRFDPSRLQVRDADVNRNGVQISPGYFPNPSQGFTVANAADNAQGTVDYAMTLLGVAPVSGSGTVATISFVATAPGESILRLETVKLATNRGEPIPFGGSDGRIIVGSDGGEQTPMPTWTPVLPTATPSPTPSPTATLVPPSVTPTATPTYVATATSTTVPVVPAGTPVATPRPLDWEQSSVWYFAEGSTNPPFHTWLLLQNPGPRTAKVRLIFMKADGTFSEISSELGPTSRRSFFVNEIVPNSDVSIVVEADSLVLAERAMYFGTDGHVSTGISHPSRRWYLAEGSTEPPFQTWILLQNPGKSLATVTVRYMLSDSSVKIQQLSVAPLSRASIYANLELPQAAFSAEIESDQPLIVERAMYTESGGGHGSPGITEPSRTWYLAEGSTEQGVDSWILLQNPGRDYAWTTLTVFMPDGRTAQSYYLLPPTSRTSVFANQILPATQFGARVEADRPIIVERAMYFGAPVRGAHASVASAVAGYSWYLPEGSTASPFHEYLLLVNPQERATVARVNFMKEDGFGVTKEFPMRPTSRLTIDVNREVPDAAVSARVTSDAPIVVERSMYFAGGQGGTNTVGIPGS